MATLDRPKLRPVRPQRIQHQGQPFVALEDPLGVVPSPVVLGQDGFHWVVQHFNGRNSLQDIQAHVLRNTGQLISTADLERLVQQLDQAMILEGPTFEAFLETYRTERTRPAAHAGRSYAATERSLRAQIGQIFAAPTAAALPAPAAQTPNQSHRLRGILAPHIDYQRGGPTYTWAYRELAEQSDAEVFVVFGVAHQYCRNRFALTRKDFATPLGLARTDRGYVDRLASLAGDHNFDDELSHRTEHSIEFQVVFLQYLLGERKDFSIVPILVGSFHDLMQNGTEPINDVEVARFVQALKAAELASEKKVAYIGSIDLCHVGPQFGDPLPVDDATRETVQRFDSAMLERAIAADPAGWFNEAARIDNRWRVCGLAATYTMLHAMGPAAGKMLHYNQAIDAERTCLVSFASVAYHSLNSE